MPVAVVGVGQSLRGDDAAGLEAVRLWQKLHAETASRPEVCVALIEAPGLELLEILRSTDAAVIVDAVQSGAAAGTLHQIGTRSISQYPSASASGHNWGIAEVLRLAQALGEARADGMVSLLGIEAAQLEFGAPLSGPVGAALSAASEAIEERVTRFLAR
jgi:hydrogenase maturation protease